MMTPDGTPQSDDVNMDEAFTNKRKHKSPPTKKGKNQGNNVITQSPHHKSNTPPTNIKPAATHTVNTNPPEETPHEDAQDSTIDYSESSYAGPWMQATGGRKNTEKGYETTKTKQPSQATAATKHKTSFEDTLPTHKSTGGKKIVRK